MATPNAAELLSQMTLAEKIDQLTGDDSFVIDGLRTLVMYNSRPFPAGENKRLGIRPLLFSDGPRGVVLTGGTCFPSAIGRGASFDVDLEERIGTAIGLEARDKGANYFAGICINLLRHPAWGRAQETYGEDPFHLGEMGAAIVRGANPYVMTCAKHFACNSMENARFSVNVQIDDRTLHEIYLPHFKRVVDEGVNSIMSAYNQVNGEHCGHNETLLRKILKEDWGFKGFVMSDFVFGTYDGHKSIEAGMDVEMPFKWRFRKLHDNPNHARLDEAVTRVLQTRLDWEESAKPVGEVDYRQHQLLAREAAQKSTVLLKNDGVLPVERGQSIAVFGAKANQPITGDLGSSKCRPPYVVTLLEGLQKESDVLYYDGDSPPRIDALAGEADVAIVVVGYSQWDEGEYIIVVGGDRDELTLSQADEELINTVSSVNNKTIVVMLGGSAIVTESWRHRVAAMVMAWYPGMEGGHAIADVLFGKANPSAKLPCVFPQHASQLPFFDKKAKWIEYGYWHGYRLLDHEGIEPAFAFGFGLSYTTFELSNLRVSGDVTLRIKVDIRNTGEHDGAEVIQVYVCYPRGGVERPVRELKAFKRVEVAAGKRVTAQLTLPKERLQYYDVDLAGFASQSGRHRLLVGTSSRKEDLKLSYDFNAKV